MLKTQKEIEEENSAPIITVEKKVSWMVDFKNIIIQYG